MQVRDFNYHLPAELIAQKPSRERAASRLLYLDGPTGRISDAVFSDLSGLLLPGDLLVLNDTRVIPARLCGKKDSGGRVEVLVERITGDHRLWAQIRASRSPRPGSWLCLENHVEVEVLGRCGDLFELCFHDPRTVTTILDAVGRVPLPPYIERAADEMDRERYQTVYACQAGSVAAPTAGLHFDQPMLQRIKAMGVDVAYVTVHIGAGTFQPIRVTRLSDHKMHAEYVTVPAGVCDQVRATRVRGGRVIAVGSTSVRGLEAAALGGDIRPLCGETDLFVYPGYRFRIVDAMVTNFHLPESTLFILVCAFAGKERVMAAYRHAVKQRYRFFSYGDAMYITRAAE